MLKTYFLTCLGNVFCVKKLITRISSFLEPSTTNKIKHVFTCVIQKTSLSILAFDVFQISAAENLQKKNLTEICVIFFICLRYDKEKGSA